MDYRSVLEAISVTQRCLFGTGKSADFPSERITDALFALTGIEPGSDDAIEIITRFEADRTPLQHEPAQQILATINEISESRKQRGVYYTPRDVVEFVVANSVNSFYGIGERNNLGSSIAADIPGEHFVFELTVLDPTCGLGEFVRGVLSAKAKMLKARSRTVTSEDVSRMLMTICGNDIDPVSTAISRLRVFLDCADIFGYETALDVVDSIGAVFTSVDFIEKPFGLDRSFDLIIGNPPYVEDSNYGNLSEKYGNVYCNVISNSIKIMTKPAVLGFVIPLSYVATPRMNRIREEVSTALPNQTILSFADRPDSLFKQVHQKLCILIAGPGDTRSIYTSNYQYWYKDQRLSLFDRMEIRENPFATRDGVPKLGNGTDIEIYERLTDETLVDIFSHARKGEHTVCVNRREAFWMKVFRGKSQHPEFKEFHFQTEPEAAFLYCLLSSSLFWWYWIAVSDCWHVSRSLNGFKMPQLEDFRAFTLLARRLENRLEETKKYVGTKQTVYEYKHVECLDIIHEIDDFINELYTLSDEQSRYIKNFAFEYRTSRKLKNA